MEMTAVPKPNEELLAEVRARALDRDELAAIYPELGYRELSALVIEGTLAIALRCALAEFQRQDSAT